MQKINNKCSVIVSSYDGSEDLWEPFFTLFFRYWPDCPYPIYLITNYKIYNHDRVTTIAVGEHKGWASNMRVVLKKIPTPYVMCLIEDLFIEKPVDSAYIDSLVEYIDDKKVAYIRLFPSPLPDHDFTNNLNLGLISKGAPYRASLTAALWDKKILNDLLVDGENIWQAELGGTERSNNVSAPFLSVKKPALIYHDRTAVVAGKWMYYAVKLCKREGLKIDLKKRKIDYFWHINLRFDQFRKYPTMRKIRSIPLVGTISAKVFRFTLDAMRRFLQ
ncbi:MAG: hypothetical protein ABR875_00910 [Minisyncoccia bacterium]